MGRQPREILAIFLRALYWIGYPFLFFIKVLVKLPKSLVFAPLLAIKVFAQLRFLIKEMFLVPSDKKVSSVSPIKLKEKISGYWSLKTRSTAQVKIIRRGDAAKRKLSTADRIAAASAKDPFFYEWLHIIYPQHFWWWNFLFELNWFGQRVWSKCHQLIEMVVGRLRLVRRPPLKVMISAAAVILVVSHSASGFYDLYLYIFEDLPSPYLIREQQPPMTTKIYDRNGDLLYTIFDQEDRVLVGLDEISPYLIQATIAIEDNNFYHHWGLSIKGIVRAIENNVQNEQIQGGSTITQQLVKNTLLSPEKTWQRKIREAILALAVDAIYSKEEILFHYLNEVNYGGSIYGVEQASQWYFGKSAKQLNLAESSFLAGLPVAPTAYSPFGPSPERAEQRQREVLRRMLEDGYVSSEQVEFALNTQLEFRHNRYEIKAPHFVMLVRELLESEYGKEVVSRGGLEVWTTLDLPTQASAEAAVKKELDRLAKLNVNNGAAMITDPRSGEILAMVGSKDYFDSSQDGQVNVTLRPRQPGSSIKPITYATAFEHGWTPSSLIDDSPVAYTFQGSPTWTPRNYDGRFRGKVTLREALASSYNIPAVRLLADVGVSNVVEKGKAMGITTWEDSSRFGLALTLGGGDVTMYDMAQVYGTFANNGYTVKNNPILEVKAADGRVLYHNPCQGATTPCLAQRTVNPLAAYQVTNILSDNSARSPAFGTNSVLNVTDHEVAVKTGTTNNLRDNWTIGYTSDRVVLTWVGNNDNQPMSSVASGITGASPIWRQIMNQQLENRATKHAFVTPDGFEKVAVCQVTNTLPCNECPKVVEEIYPLGMAPTTHCTASMFDGEITSAVKTADR